MNEKAYIPVEFGTDTKSKKDYVEIKDNRLVLCNSFEGYKLSINLSAVTVLVLSALEEKINSESEDGTVWKLTWSKMVK